MLFGFRNLLSRRLSVNAIALALFAAGLFLLSPYVHAQSVPGFQAPEKPQTKAELPLEIRAAFGEAPLRNLLDFLTADPGKIRRLAPIEEREKREVLRGKATRIGVVRQLPTPLDAFSDAAVHNVADGEVRVMAVVSEGAVSLRVRFAKMSLPAGARVFVYSLKDPTDFHGPYTAKGLSADGTFWTPPMKGDAVVVEYFVPTAKTGDRTAPFKIVEVAHVYKDPMNLKVGNCHNEVAEPWTATARSVGRLDFVSGGSVGSCTGTLLNDASSSQTPYVLTANHCFDTQTEAQSLRVYWNYNAGDSPPPGTPFTDGANLLATGTASDFTFVRLTGSVPGGLFYSGWDAAQFTGTAAAAGIHHPDASHKRISFGNARQPTSGECGSGLQCLAVDWTSAVTEPGSSGSGIWKGLPSDPGGAKLIGTLTGGPSFCGAPQSSLKDFYGRFSVTYQSISSFLEGTNCVTSISPTNQTFTASGGSGSFNVFAPGTCNWTANTSDSFVTINSGASGTGNGTVTFTVASNGGGQRSASIIAGGQSFSVVQNGGGGCAPTPISFGQTINGNLTTSDCPLGDGSFYDPYSFSGTAGQQISIFMSGSFDTYLFLLNPSGSVIAENDDGGGGTNSRIPAGSGTFTLPSTGTYTIYANSFFASATGTYSLTLNGTVPALPTISFGGSNYSVTEFSGRVEAVVLRGGSTASESTVDYSTSDTAGLNPCSMVNGVASARCDYTYAVGTLRFAPGESAKTLTVPIIDDAIVDGTETFSINLSNPTNGSLGSIQTATGQIFDNDPGTVNGNPIDQTPFFVRQHYLDFLGREGEPLGQQGWENILNNCPPSGRDVNGNFCDRIEVSAGFFRSAEFQQRGYYIYRFFSAVGRIPVYPEFIPDFAKVSGFLSDQQLEERKAAFVTEFMARAEFQNRYSATFSNPTAYVDALLQTVGLPAHPGRQHWINLLTANNSSQTRGQVLRELVESGEVFQKFYNEAFVIMQYFGYLRRTADGSYVQWINTMNQTGGDYRIMINGFMNSAEYRQRFGP